MDDEINAPEGQEPNPVAASVPQQDWRELRRQERRERRQARRESRGSSGWLGGVVLILLGLYFLLQNFTNFELQNWWALFILIPAVSSFANAWNGYRESDNQLTSAVTRPLLSGTILTFIAAIFLFGIDFGIFWPVLIILGGLMILFNGVLNR